MKKIMNRPEDFVDESLEGILLANAGRLRCDPDDRRAICSVTGPRPGKVAIVTGGGYGHLPVFLGYVGDGLCDGAAVGNVFTSPSFDTIWKVTQQVERGAGVLYLYGNYMGDGMNFDMAMEMAELEDIPAATVRVADDVASAPRGEREGRRGIAGLFFAYKLAGACADTMAPLGEVRRVAAKTVENTATFGVALSSCQLPCADRPVFELGADEMEIGMGIHGEAGVRSGRLRPSAEIAQELVEAVVGDLGLSRGERVAVLVNGLGATSREELYIFYRDAARCLERAGVTIDRSFVGEYATSLEMSGLSVTLLRLDEELARYLSAPARSPFIIV